MPRRTVEKFLSQIKKGEFLSPVNNRRFKSILGKLEYEVTDVCDLGSTTSIDIRIKNINMEKYMSELNSKMEDFNGRKGKTAEQDMNDYVDNFFSNLIDRQELEFSEKTITAVVIKEDKRYNIKNSDEIVTAMMGIGEE